MKFEIQYEITFGGKMVIEADTMDEAIYDTKVIK